MENGRKVCNELKAVRKLIADANGIEYSPTECTHMGECAGTCLACEQEVKYIERELNVRRMLGKVAIVAGLGLSVVSCAGGCSSQRTGDVPYTPTTSTDNNEMIIMGDVVKEPDSVAQSQVDGLEDVVCCDSVTQ